MSIEALLPAWRSTLFLASLLPLLTSGIAQGNDTGFANVHAMTNIGARLFFTADSKTSGRELWISENGKGPRLVKDIHPGPGAAAIDGIIALNSVAVFVADDGKNGSELWRSDGSEPGTMMIQDIAAGTKGSGITLTAGIAVVKDTLYFLADDGKHGRELWKTNGTETGTTLVHEFVPEASGLANANEFAYRMTAFGDHLILQIPAAEGTAQLWRSDGTSGGTTRLSDALLPITRGPFVHHGGKLFFGARTGTEWSIWVSDGTPKGTKRLGGDAGGPLAGPPPTAKEKRLAKIQFRTYCVTCHGLKGKGDGPAGMALKPRPRDWTDGEWQKTVDDQRLFKVIKDGGLAVGLSPLMAPNPMYRNRPGVIKALVQFVRKCGKSKRP